MKASTVIAIATGLTASLVSAQGLDSIPSCALQCAISSLGSTGCDTTNIACICQATGFVTSLLPCVQSSCDAAELEATVQAATQLCLGAGVTLSVPVPTAAPTASSSSSVAESSYPATTEVVSTTLTTAVSNMTTTNTATVVPVPTGNSTVTQPPAPSGTDDSAAGRNTVALGGLGAIAALVAALL